MDVSSLPDIIIKSKIDAESFGLKQNMIYDTELSKELKYVYLKEGLATLVTANWINQGEVDVYSEKEYPNRTQAIRNNTHIVANVGDGNTTSSTFIESEWKALISIPLAHTDRVYMEGEYCYESSILYKANTTTSSTFVASEWDQV
jgi:hypothetical protein